MDRSCNLILQGIFCFVLIAGFAGLSSAWGISSHYHSNNPLYIMPGDSVDFQLSLQNMVGGEDLVLSAELVSGGEVARITDDSTVYSVPYGTKNVPVNVRVEIPSSVELGTEYRVSVAFQEVKEAEGGTVALQSKVVKSIPVYVGERPVFEPQLAPSESAVGSSGIALIVIAIVVATILYYLMLRKKKDKKSVGRTGKGRK